MLLRQDGRRHEDGHLLAAHDRFEGGAEGYLRLAEAHIAADEAVHWHGLFHTLFDLRHGPQLILRFFIRKGVFKFALKGRVRRKSVTRHDFPRRI